MFYGSPVVGPELLTTHRRVIGGRRLYVMDSIFAGGHAVHRSRHRCLWDGEVRERLVCVDHQLAFTEL